ncbi:MULTISPECIES: cysteine-rich CWC family protein [Neobacillus]|uniref:Cysteine-rich CWC family protein n=1 Tax=Neobacillus citreus TaxID=2833578 RepID=A0A942YDV4_9BACI|nr:cysteine-rich CWC family protein [Neobacillus citreus]MCH6266906.1 cysteine-rich CWC family protein [Neobacillus citreus]
MANKYCPICGEANGCMSGAGEHGNCWCDAEVFPNEILELVPAESIRKDCICKKCLDKFREEHLSKTTIKK